MDVTLLDLPWLVPAPEDFRDAVRDLRVTSPQWRTLARRLAGYRLVGNRLQHLGAAIGKLVAEEGDAIRLGVLSNGTADLLYPALTVSALRHGEWLQTIGAAFDQVAAEALNPHSQINRARCHFILLCLDHRGLPLTPAIGDMQRANSVVDEALRYVDSLRTGLRDASACTVIVQTAPQVTTNLFGSRERHIPGTLQWMIDHYNQQLRERVGYSRDLLLDTAALAELVGLERWHDPVQWALGKFSFAQTLVPLYCDWVARLIAATRGNSRKCLVLDLDNTLWGGVVGDDGVAGIVLGNGHPTGEAFLRVQQTALALRDRGVVLAVASKNDDAVAREAFRVHPEMVLKEEHIAVFQANWHSKDANLRAIAKTLNLGLDALVFLDDNPVERAQVRAALPQVAVPELPADPAHYSDVLLAAGYFESIAFTEEDRQRAAQYQANAVRAELLHSAVDMESHLRSLDMRAVITPFDTIGLARITQLINKTNQFNLTTKRYTVSEVAAFQVSPDGLTAQVRLIDRFGDNGMISVVICTKEGADWVIDTWLMSCRVLGRGVEQATLNHLVSRAKDAGIRSLIGHYERTERNGMVKDLYSRLGFAPVHVSEARSRWRLDVAHYVAADVPIEIISTLAEGELRSVS